MDPEDFHDNHDLNFVKALIEKMQEKYNIDPGRIFMQGMSMGHMMTDQFARYYGDILAGAAGSGASAFGSQLYEEDGSIRNWGGPVPTWISHPEKNGMDGPMGDEKAAQDTGIAYWSKINGVSSAPQIRIVGEDNFAFFTGDKADLVFLDIKNRDHGQALDEAFYYWNYMFSGLHREPNGALVKEKTIWEWLSNSVTEMPLAPIMWQKLKYHGLDGGQIVRGEYMCVSLRFLAKAFGASYTTENGGLEAVLTLADGRVAKFSRGVIGCLVDDNMYSMYCETLHRQGELLVSIEWFCRFLFNMNVSVCDDVVYVTDHFAELSTFMAELIKDQLK
jgi:hypothetical protein